MRRWTPQLIAQAIRDRYEHGKPISSYEVQKDDSGLETAARRHLGGWENALRYAGFDPDDIYLIHYWDRHELLSILEAICDGDGLAPRSCDVDQGFLMACVRMFGSWEKAVETAGHHMAPKKDMMSNLNKIGRATLGWRRSRTKNPPVLKVAIDKLRKSKK